MPGTMTAAQDQTRRLGRYELLYLLGQGGMGEVHLARLTGAAGFEKLCILKTILPQVRADPQFVDRFHHEARVLVQLNHSHIAQVYDMGEVEDTLYMAIEYVAGVDLSRVLDRTRSAESRIPLPVAMFLGQQILEALGYAHRKVGPDGAPLGIVHRDVSPHNVMVSYEGEVKVIDFGLAKSAARSKATLPSTVLGKLGYMAPEQAMARSVDHRGDIYSAGIVLWELIAGRPLFEGGTVGEMVARMSNPTIPPLQSVRDDVSEAVDRLVSRALQADPSARYSRADDFARALNEHAVREGLTISAEEVGNYVRAMCPEEFAAERQLQSRLSSLGRVKNSRSSPMVAGTAIRGPASVVAQAGAAGGELLTPAQRALSQMAAPISGPDVARRPAAPLPGPRTDPSLAAAPPPGASLVVPKNRTPMLVAGLVLLAVVGAGGVVAWSSLQGDHPAAEPKPAEPAGPAAVAENPEPAQPATPEKPVELAAPPLAAAPPDAEQPVDASEPVSRGRIEAKTALKVVLDKDEYFVVLAGTQAGEGDVFKLVGPPASPKSKQRDWYVEGVVMDLKGKGLARLVLSEKVPLPPELYAVKEAARRPVPTAVLAAASPVDKGDKGDATSAQQPQAAAQPAAAQPAVQPAAQPAVQPAAVQAAAASPTPAAKPGAAQPAAQPTVATAARPQGSPQPGTSIQPAAAGAPVPQRTLVGEVEVSEVTVSILNKSQFDWSDCEVRLPPNKVHRFPSILKIVRGGRMPVSKGQLKVDARAPDAQVLKGAWALMRCKEGAGYLAYDRSR